MKEIALRDKVGKKKNRSGKQMAQAGVKKYLQEKGEEAATVFSRAEIQKKGKT